MMSGLLDEMVTLLAAGLAITLGTNLDNLVVLTALAGALADGARQGRRALWIAAALVLAAAWVLSLLAAGLPAHHSRWMGLVPLGLGLFAGWRALRGGASADEAPVAAGGSMVALLLVNSTDTLATLTPLLAETASPLRLAIVVGMAMGTAVLAAVLGRVLGHDRLRAALERHGAWLAPLIMICVGLYILADTGTDLV